MGRLRQQWVTVALTLLAAAAAVTAYVVGVEAGGAEGRRRAVLLVLGGTLTGLGILLAGVEKLRSDRARRTAEQVAVDAQESLTLTLNGALAPLTSYLGELAAATSHPQRQALTGQIRQAVVDAAVKLTCDGARSAFYSADPDGASLTRVTYAGRSELPREQFVAGTADGDFVLELVANGDLLFVDDIAASTLVTPSTTGYATVVAVAVTAGPRRIGMLTVDAPRPSDLTPTDVELVRVLANLLGTGLAGASNREPFG